MLAGCKRLGSTALIKLKSPLPKGWSSSKPSSTLSTIYAVPKILLYFRYGWPKRLPQGGKKHKNTED